jgi:hypothetical protein
MPTSAATSWLFWITLSLGLFMAVYTPYRLWSEAAQQVDQQGLSLASVGVYFLGALSGLLALRWCILLIMSYASMARGERALSRPCAASLPYVSILAPAYCEAACVQDAMCALVRLDYPAYEVIFVDDGSSDNTYDLALSFAGTHCSERGRCDVRVFTKPNQGKWERSQLRPKARQRKLNSLYRCRFANRARCTQVDGAAYGRRARRCCLGSNPSP